MGHEITSSDNVLLVRERAWHGLGVVIPDHVAPTESLGIIGADWGVRQLRLKAFDPETQMEIDVPDSLLNVRADNNQVLGIVSDHYQVFSNRQVAEFCEALVEVGGDLKSPVRVETAGTIRGGKKVWFLLRGKEFDIANGDGIVPYVLVSNGHDGKTSLSVTPTTIRVVCSNTFHMVVPEGVSGYSTAAISIEHMGNLDEKVKAARRALETYNYALAHTQSAMTRLAEREIKHTEMLEFFTRCYEHDFVKRETDRANIIANRERRAKEDFGAFVQRFESERDKAGNTWWNAFNAYTGMLQHDRSPGKGKTDMERIESRIRTNLLGLNVDRAHEAFGLALELSTAT